MTEQEAIRLIKSKLSGYRIRKLKESSGVFVFMCESPDPEVIPSKLVAAVNRKNGKIASSITSIEEVIKAVK